MRKARMQERNPCLTFLLSCLPHSFVCSLESSFSRGAAMRPALCGILMLGVVSVLLSPMGQPDEPKSKEAKPRHTNRLARETSPYLLQHAHNPVDWYPWGQEAFAKAKKEGKLVFLSI